jgi:hypothetical protein
MGLTGNRAGWFGGRQGRAIGKTKFGEIRTTDLDRADSDMRVLGMMLGDPRAPTGMEYMTLARMPSADRADTYAMLLQEADQNGVRVGETDIDSFLASMGLGETNYEAFLDQQLRPQNVTETQFRAAIKDWLAIHKMFATSLVITPPSEREVSYLCRDLGEKIDLRVLEFSAEKYLDAVPAAVDPNDVQQQFARYRTVPAGQFSEENPFGFGYYQSDRVQLTYAYFSRQVIERAVRVPRSEVDKYYVDPAHRGEFVRMARPTAASSSAPATGEANRLVPVPMSADEATPLIVRKLTAQKVAAKIAELTTKFAALLAEAPAGTPPGAVYQAAWSKMLLPNEANAALDASVDTTSIGSMKLDAAVNRLADLAKLSAIAFPWGEHGQNNLSPDIVVKLEGTMTLREALKKLCEDAKWKPIEWGMCAGLDKVLFPLGGEGAADFFPVVVRTTGLLDTEAFRKDETLMGTMATPPLRASVGSLAFMAKPFNRPPQAAQAGTPLKEGEDGPVMTVWRKGAGEMAESGTLPWRLLRAVPGQAPQQLTDEIRKQVETDIRLRKAFDLAYQRADQIRTVEQFNAADANTEADAISTGSFPRRQPSGAWAVPPALGLPAAEPILKAFVDSSFALAPGAAEGATIGLLKLPSVRQVLVMKRAGFQPVTREEYQDQDRMQVLVMLYQGQNQMCRQVWFTPQYVQQRVGWVAEAGAKPTSDTPAEQEPIEGY